MDPAIRQLLVSLGLPSDATDEAAMQFLRERLSSGAPSTAAAEVAAVTGAAQMSAGPLSLSPIQAERARMSAIVSIGQDGMGADAPPVFNANEMRSFIEHGTSADEVMGHARARLGARYAPFAVGVRHDEPQIHVGTDRQRDQLIDGAAHALAMNAGVAIRNPSPRAQQFVGRRATDVCHAMLAAAGVDTRGMTRAQLATAMINPRAALGNQFPRWAQLMATTGDYSSVITASANATLRSGYTENPPTWSAWAKRGTVPNFKLQERPVLSNIATPKEVKEGEEYENTYPTDSAETFRVKKYGNIFQCTMEMIVNDQLGAFMSIVKKQGEAARRIEDDVAYAQLTSNPTLDADSTPLFHASHGNLITGAGAPSVASLGAARAKMARQTGPGGEVLNIRPWAILVPVELQTETEQLVASLVDPSKSNDANNPSFIRNLIVVGEARLSVASMVQWYLAASPSSIDTIEVAFLEDEQSPVMFEEEGFRVDGTSYKTRHTVGARALDHRGLLRHNNAA